MNGFADCLSALILEGEGDGLDLNASMGIKRLAPEDLNAPTVAGFPALFWAIRGRHTACIQVLVDAGCDVNAVVAGATPLLAAMGRWWSECPEAPMELRQRVEVVQTLIRAKADVALPGRGYGEPVGVKGPVELEGTTPLMQACIQGSAECVQRILQGGLPSSATDDGGAADGEGRKALAMAQNRSRFTALHFAADCGHLQLLDLLLGTAACVRCGLAGGGGAACSLDYCAGERWAAAALAARLGCPPRRHLSARCGSAFRWRHCEAPGMPLHAHGGMACACRARSEQGKRQLGDERRADGPPLCGSG